MTELEKTEIFRRWQHCNRQTQITLTCAYLKKMRQGRGHIGWLNFLKNNLQQRTTNNELDK